jgi:hypothetical protein
MITGLIASGLFDIGKALIDKLIPDPAENAKAQLELMRLDQNGQLTELQTRMSTIMAEAQSEDPWTSRARPSFMYIFYAIILSMVVVAPLLGIFFPGQMDAFFSNVGKGFSSIPEELWWTFSVGYLGYSGSKTFERVKGVK